MDRQTYLHPAPAMQRAYILPMSPMPIRPTDLLVSPRTSTLRVVEAAIAAVERDVNIVWRKEREKEKQSLWIYYDPRDQLLLR